MLLTCGEGAPRKVGGSSLRGLESLYNCTPAQPPCHLPLPSPTSSQAATIKAPGYSYGHGTVSSLNEADDLGWDVSDVQGQRMGQLSAELAQAAVESGMGSALPPDLWSRMMEVAPLLRSSCGCSIAVRQNSRTALKVLSKRESEGPRSRCARVHNVAPATGQPGAQRSAAWQAILDNRVLRWTHNSSRHALPPDWPGMLDAWPSCRAVLALPLRAPPGPPLGCLIIGLLEEPPHLDLQPVELLCEGVGRSIHHLHKQQWEASMNLLNSMLPPALLRRMVARTAACAARPPPAAPSLEGRPPATPTPPLSGSAGTFPQDGTARAQFAVREIGTCATPHTKCPALQAKRAGACTAQPCPIATQREEGGRPACSHRPQRQGKQGARGGGPSSLDLADSAMVPSSGTLPEGRPPPGSALWKPPGGGADRPPPPPPPPPHRHQAPQGLPPQKWTLEFLDPGLEASFKTWFNARQGRADLHVLWSYIAMMPLVIVGLAARGVLGIPALVHCGQVLVVVGVHAGLITWSRGWYLRHRPQVVAATRTAPCLLLLLHSYTRPESYSGGELPALFGCCVLSMPLNALRHRLCFTNHLVLQLLKLYICTAHCALLYSDHRTASKLPMGLGTAMLCQLGSETLASGVLYCLEYRLRMAFIWAGHQQNGRAQHGGTAHLSPAAKRRAA